jgi:electron transfer flavoprotein beta subunit
VNAARTGVEKENVKQSMNPFCEIATEEAVRWKEAKIATEVVALSVGPKQVIIAQLHAQAACSCFSLIPSAVAVCPSACICRAQAAEVLRTALAMGADRAIHVETEEATDLVLQPLVLSKIFKNIIERVKADAAILGKQAIDDDSNQLGQMLAGQMRWPIATFASKIAISSDKKSATVTREIDGGLQQITVPLPAVFTADLRLNQPRYATLPNIMKAKKKPIEVIPMKDIPGIDFGPRLKVLSVTEPATRKAGVKIESVDDLYRKLKDEAKLI